MNAWGLSTPHTWSSSASDLARALNTQLWDSNLGFYTARNISTNLTITNRTYIMGFPLFGGGDDGLVSSEQVIEVVGNLLADDMNSPFGLRSTSSLDPRYDNENEIYPYSDWRGPVWINANVAIAYGLADHGYTLEASKIADSIVTVLANDLRR